MSSRFGVQGLLVVVFGLAGCEVPMQPGPPPAPDCVRYGGVYFISADGMRSFSRVNIVPRQAGVDTKLILPDGASVAPSELTPELLESHGVKCEIVNRISEADFKLVARGFQVRFKDHMPVHIVVLYIPPTRQDFVVQIGKAKVRVEISREALEGSLGPPDETLIDQIPPEQ